MFVFLAMQQCRHALCLDAQMRKYTNATFFIQETNAFILIIFKIICSAVIWINQLLFCLSLPLLLKKYAHMEQMWQ